MSNSCTRWAAARQQSQTNRQQRLHKDVWILCMYVHICMSACVLSLNMLRTRNRDSCCAFCSVCLHVHDTPQTTPIWWLVRVCIRVHKACAQVRVPTVTHICIYYLANYVSSAPCTGCNRTAPNAAVTAHHTNMMQTLHSKWWCTRDAARPTLVRVARNFINTHASGHDVNTTTYARQHAPDGRTSDIHNAGKLASRNHHHRTHM